MTEAFQQEIEAALLKIADNIYKHVVQRSGWNKDDECFRLDLREAQESLTKVLTSKLADLAAQRDELVTLCKAVEDYLRPLVLPAHAAVLRDELTETIARVKGKPK